MNQILYYRKPQSSAFSLFLCGEKWSKDLFLDLRGHARTIIGYRHCIFHAVSVHDQASLYHDTATLFLHRLHRIVAQVDDDLVHHSGTAHNPISRIRFH